MLGDGERRLLLDLARRSMDAAVRGVEPPRVDEGTLPDPLCSPHAAFVTLTEHGELRGCIGTLDFARPLWASVVAAARAAALDDPRFEPVSVPELPGISLEISVLEPPVELEDAAAFVPAAQGIIVERGWARGLLLPQVAAERGWDGPTTLGAACRKAGLPSDAWRDGHTRLQVFESTHFGDDDELPGTSGQSGSLGPPSE